MPGHVMDRHRRERDQRQERIEAEHGENGGPVPLGIVFEASFASSDMFEIVSIPV